MSYGRDYGNRNFLDRAAHAVRGWIGHRGGHGYDDGFRGGDRGWDEGRGGYRGMGGPGGAYRDWRGGMEHGYGSTNWTGRNPDWDRGYGGWGRGVGEGYRTGGYQPHHDMWDVDWDDRTLPQGGTEWGGTMGRRSGGMMGSGSERGQDRGYLQGRDFMTNQPAFDAHGGYRDDMEPRMRGGVRRGMTGRRMERGGYGGAPRGRDRGEWSRDGRDRRDDRDRPAGMGGMGYGGAMPGREADLGDVDGGTIGNYGPYGNYGIERFRSGSSGGVPTGQYWTGYGHGSGYRG